MKTTLISVFALALLLSFSCKTPPPVAPQNVDSAAVLAAVELRMSILGFETSRTPDVLYFVELKRLDGGVPANFRIPRLTEANLPTSIIKSTYSTNTGVYWLNASPGAYALVGASYSETVSGQQTSTPVGDKGTLTVKVKGGTKVYATFFSLDFANEHAFVVAPGKLTTLGKFNAKVELSERSNSDPLQEHLANMMLPGYYDKSALSNTFGKTVHAYVPVEMNAQTDSTSRESMQNLAKEDFLESPWAGYAD